MNGVGRWVLFAMAQRREMPAPLAHVEAGSPRRAVWAIGAVIAKFRFGGTQGFHFRLLDRLGLLKRLSASNLDFREDLLVGEAVQANVDPRLLPLVLQHVEVFDHDAGSRRAR